MRENKELKPYESNQKVWSVQHAIQSFQIILHLNVERWNVHLCAIFKTWKDLITLNFAQQFDAIVALYTEWVQRDTYFYSFTIRLNIKEIVIATKSNDIIVCSAWFSSLFIQYMLLQRRKTLNITNSLVWVCAILDFFFLYYLTPTIGVGLHDILNR